MDKLHLDGNALTFSEKQRARQLYRAKGGVVTVQEMREWIAPTGGRFVVEIVGVTIIALGLGIFFLPFIFVGLVAPLVMLAGQKKRTKRWATILPHDDDERLVSLA